MVANEVLGHGQEVAGLHYAQEANYLSLDTLKRWRMEKHLRYFTQAIDDGSITIVLLHYVSNDLK